MVLFGSKKYNGPVQGQAGNATILTGSRLYAALREAINDKSWSCSNTVLVGIAESTTGPNIPVVIKAIAESITAKPIKWKVIFKGLVLLEFVLKFGQDAVETNFRDFGTILRPLKEFSFTENKTERGTGIREKSKYIMQLLEEQKFLVDERAQAMQSWSKVHGASTQSVSSATVSQNPTKAESFTATRNNAAAVSHNEREELIMTARMKEKDAEVERAEREREKLRRRREREKKRQEAAQGVTKQVEIAEPVVDEVQEAIQEDKKEGDDVFGSTFPAQNVSSTSDGMNGTSPQAAMQGSMYGANFNNSSNAQQPWQQQQMNNSMATNNAMGAMGGYTPQQQFNGALPQQQFNSVLPQQRQMAGGMNMQQPRQMAPVMNQQQQQRQFNMNPQQFSSVVPNQQIFASNVMRPQNAMMNQQQMMQQQRYNMMKQQQPPNMMNQQMLQQKGMMTQQQLMQQRNGMMNPQQMMQQQQLMQQRNGAMNPQQMMQQRNGMMNPQMMQQMMVPRPQNKSMSMVPMQQNNSMSMMPMQQQNPAMINRMNMQNMPQRQVMNQIPQQSHNMSMGQQYVSHPQYGSVSPSFGMVTGQSGRSNFNTAQMAAYGVAYGQG